MTDKTSTRLIAVVLAVMTIGGIAVSGVAVAQETAGNDGDVDTQQSSHLRVIHAASGAPAVDIAVDGEQVASNVEAGNATDYLELEAGNHTVQVTASDTGADTNETDEATTDTESEDALFEGQIYLEPRTSSTLALTADGTQMDSVDEGTTDTAADVNETENGATATPATETPAADTEAELGAENGTETGTDTETAGTETPVGTETATAAGADNETEGGAAEAPAADDSQEVTSLSPVMYIDNAWEPADDEAAVSIVHLVQNADAVDVTVAGNQSDDGAAESPTANDTETETETADDETAVGDENETEGDAAEAPTDDATVLADDLNYQSASDYVTVPAGDHTLEIRQASENNDGEVITTVNITVEGGNAYSALVMDDTSGQTTDGATEGATADTETELGNDTETELGEDDETEDNATALGEETETEDNATALGEETETEDNATALGEETETEDNATTLGEETETEDNETELGEETETEDTETELGEDNETEGGAAEGPAADDEAGLSLTVTTVEDVTYTVNLPSEEMDDNETDAGDDAGEDEAMIAAPV